METRSGFLLRQLPTPTPYPHHGLLIFPVRLNIDSPTHPIHIHSEPQKVLVWKGGFVNIIKLSSKWTRPSSSDCCPRRGQLHTTRTGEWHCEKEDIQGKHHVGTEEEGWVTPGARKDSWKLGRRHATGVRANSLILDFTNGNNTYLFF